jgi:hypothetical protein
MDPGKEIGGPERRSPAFRILQEEDRLGVSVLLSQDAAVTGDVDDLRAVGLGETVAEVFGLSRVGQDEMAAALAEQVFEGEEELLLLFFPEQLRGSEAAGAEARLDRFVLHRCRVKPRTDRCPAGMVAAVSSTGSTASPGPGMRRTISSSPSLTGSGRRGRLISSQGRASAAGSAVRISRVTS